MFVFLYSWFMNQPGPDISCTITQTLPNLLLFAPLDDDGMNAAGLLGKTTTTPLKDSQENWLSGGFPECLPSSPEESPKCLPSFNVGAILRKRSAVQQRQSSRHRKLGGVASRRQKKFGSSIDEGRERKGLHIWRPQVLGIFWPPPPLCLQNIVGEFGVFLDPLPPSVWTSYMEAPRHFRILRSFSRFCVKIHPNVAIQWD